jgi:hypothetical protein
MTDPVAGLIEKWGKVKERTAKLDSVMFAATKSAGDTFETCSLELKAALPAHDAAIRAEAVAGALGAACEAICEYCAHPDWFVEGDARCRATPARADSAGIWEHIVEDKYGSFTPVDCQAQRIRALKPRFLLKPTFTALTLNDVMKAIPVNRTDAGSQSWCIEFATNLNALGEQR